MPARPPKKRKVILEISDDDGYEEQSLLTIASSAPAQRTRSSTRRAVRSSQPTLPNTNSEDPPPSTAQVSRKAAYPATAAPSKLKAASKSKTNALKKPATSPPKKPPAGNRSIYSFFSATQRGPPSVVGASASQHPSPVSQHEDVEDLIEDGFSDDGVWGGTGDNRPRATQTSSSSQSTLRKFVTGTGQLESRGHTFLSSATTRVQRVDSRPWPERFAPKTLSALAVNPRKVAEVRAWFEHVFDGFSKQRLLVLKGPAGTGKTATLKVLSKELGLEILEWKNPSSAVGTGNYGEETAFGAGLAGIFEEFVGRAGRFSSLDLASTAQPPGVSSSGANSTQGGTLSDAGEKRKVILIEDFPNALFTSSPAPLASFRHTIKSFLALLPPPQFSAPLPPLVLIISESANIAAPSAFTAHRLLSPEIMHHPLAASITFNKIAPTFMVKALSAIIIQESRESGRSFVPSRAMLGALSTSGDIRSAIMGLEFLAVNGDLGAFSERLRFNEKKGKKGKAPLLGGGELNDIEQEILQTVTQRESSLGFFHAVGKVVYNKRYGDDAEDPYAPPPPKPSLDSLPYRNRASKVDFDSLMDDSGADPQTFISGLHENYLGSCNLLGGLSPSHGDFSLEDSLACAVSCIENLSDSDLLSSSPYRNASYADDTNSSNIKLHEISFQAAARGIILGLPAPVKRMLKDHKMFYPTSLRLWRQTEEITGLVDLFSRRDDLTGGAGVARAELLMDRMPYLKIVHRARRPRAVYSAAAVRELEVVTGFTGVGARSEDVPLPGEDCEIEAVGDELEQAENGQQSRWSGRERRKRINLKPPRPGEGDGDDLATVGGVEKLILSDDDIEDDW